MKYVQFAGTGFNNYHLCVQVRDYAEDPLVWHGGLKAGWATAVLDAQAQIASEVSRIKLPFITIHGTDDRMVDIASSKFLFDNAQSEDKTFEVVRSELILRRSTVIHAYVHDFGSCIY